MLNGHGICHGGSVFLLADTAFACSTYGVLTVAAACEVAFVARGRGALRLPRCQVILT